MFLKIRGEQVYLWRAADEHGQVREILTQEHSEAEAAKRFFRRLLDHTGEPPERIRTDKLASYEAAKKRLPSSSEWSISRRTLALGSTTGLSRAIH